jgi:hypothetical protein
LSRGRKEKRRKEKTGGVSDLFLFEKKGKAKRMEEKETKDKRSGALPESPSKHRPNAENLGGTLQQLPA